MKVCAYAYAQASNNRVVQVPYLMQALSWAVSSRSAHTKRNVFTLSLRVHSEPRKKRENVGGYLAARRVWRERGLDAII